MFTATVAVVLAVLGGTAAIWILSGLVKIGQLILIAMGLLEPSVPEPHVEPTDPVDTRTVLTFLAVGLAFLFQSIFVFAAWNERTAWKKAARQLRTLLAHAADPITPSRLIALLEQAGDWRHVHRTVALARRHPGGLLPETLTFVDDLVAAQSIGGHVRFRPDTYAETGGLILGRKAHVELPPGAGQSFRDWAAASRKAPDVILALTDVAVDQLGLLLADHGVLTSVLRTSQPSTPG
ncbi:hypothetical protein [Paractinoplanes toevensis]|uniref:Uncharacterized protein n=1 Tax=Paractinoplanes toevensis TaxID=571911 RepID=A0A919TH62_9ACTN|nr:hypothetical protein [Actinoplanes toevensis]GIM95323.1 hypothetical protein Ato02nite_071160 [Actinoplanes toevensis]